MSNVHISIVRVTGMRSTSGEVIAVENSDNEGTAEVKISSGTSQPTTTLAVTAVGNRDYPGRYAWCVTNMGVDPIYGTSGAGTPVATAGVSKAIMPYQTRFIRCKAFGDKFAIINVT